MLDEKIHAYVHSSPVMASCIIIFFNMLCFLLTDLILLSTDYASLANPFFTDYSFQLLSAARFLFLCLPLKCSMGVLFNSSQPTTTADFCSVLGIIVKLGGKNPLLPFFLMTGANFLFSIWTWVYQMRLPDTFSTHTENDQNKIRFFSIIH